VNEAAMRAPRRAGIIAAGRGDRLRSDADALKPLVRVNGQALIEHVLRSLAEAAPSEVVIIVNDASLAVRDHVSAKTWPFPIQWIVETTPSSMHSFLRVVETLSGAGDGPFLVSTVDTVAPRGAYARFIHTASRRPIADVTLAVTDPVDDDKPLLLAVGDGNRVIALGDHVDRRTVRNVYATAGYYLVRPTVLREAHAARQDGLTAMRTFFARLLDRGYSLVAVHASKSVDVDRWEDVAAAETMLRQVDA
jgi:NDP-sugar pyrophosphorylase family protein